MKAKTMILWSEPDLCQYFPVMFVHPRQSGNALMVSVLSGSQAENTEIDLEWVIEAYMSHFKLAGQAEHTELRTFN